MREKRLGGSRDDLEKRVRRLEISQAVLGVTVLVLTASCILQGLNALRMVEWMRSVTETMADWTETAGEITGTLWEFVTALGK